MNEEKNNNHGKEHSLTSPSDRDPENKWFPEKKVDLTEEETVEAMKELEIKDFVEKFPRTDRTYADPYLPGQLVGLVSFTPAKGAKPNDNGVYGFAKLRGNFSSNEEASARAEKLIRECDSYNKIFHTYVGRPFPLTVKSTYSKDVNEIDIRKETTDSVSAAIKNQKKEDQQVIREIKEKEAELLADVAKEEDPYDKYITLKVKYAQLSWTYIEHSKKMEEIKGILLKTRKELGDLDDEHEDFKNTYRDKYVEARKAAGLKEDTSTLENNFMKYLGQDADLPF